MTTATPFYGTAAQRYAARIRQFGHAIDNIQPGQELIIMRPGVEVRVSATAHDHQIHGAKINGVIVDELKQD